MSWSLSTRSQFSKFGEFSCEIQKDEHLYTGVHIDVSMSWCIETWFYCKIMQPCTIFCSDDSMMGVFLNRSGNYILRLNDHFSNGYIDMSSYKSELEINKNEWNHVSLQYSGIKKTYYLYSNGKIVHKKRCLHANIDTFDRITFGSNVFNDWRMEGFIDSVRISSCERYTGLTYKIPHENFEIDKFTETFNNFEDPVFKCSENIKSSEKYWVNTKLNKSSRQSYMGKTSLIVDETSSFLPSMKIPGIDMNEFEWTVEFFFMFKQTNHNERKLIECGNLSIYINEEVLKLYGNNKRICKLKSKINDWNHLFISHSKNNKCLYLGMNGLVKKYNRSFKIVTGDGIVMGSNGEEIFFDCFRIYSNVLYDDDYEIPNPHNWSHIDSETITYTNFENENIGYSNITSFSVEIYWESVTGSGLYTIYKDGKKTLYETKETDCVVYGLTEDTVYEFEIYRNKKRIHNMISIKTNKEVNDDNSNILTSIIKKGVYDMDLVPEKTKKHMYSNNMFDENDKILVSNKKGKLIADFTPINSIIGFNNKDAILIPFSPENGSNQVVHVQSSNGIVNIEFNEKEDSILIRDEQYKIGDYFILDGKKVRVTKN